MKHYKVKDLYCASFILAKGQELVRVDRVSGVCWFVFADSDQCERIANTFWSGKGMCYGLTYANSIKNLKDRIFSS